MFRQTPIHLRFLLTLVSALTFSFCAGSVTHAQNTNATNGSTPAGLTPGAPAGSYGLSGFDNVNLYNGNMNFRLPLVSIGGRGGASYTMTLPIEQHWTIDHYVDPDTGQTIDTPSGNWWGVISPGYYPGVMQRRIVSSLSVNCGTQQHPLFVARRTVTRLTFTANDGTEYELVDQASGGAMQFASPCTRSRSRGKVFISHDGSGATFVSDTEILDPYYGDQNMISSDGWTDTEVSGYLFLRDGTRYRIADGYVTQIRDRNGNLLNFTSDGLTYLTVTDSLNRQVTINYNYQDVAPYGLCDRITFKGFGGATRIIRISKTALGNALKSGWSLQTDYQLFGLYTGSSSLEDPTVISAVWLPNDDGLNRHYQFYYNSYAELARVELPTGGAFEYDWAQGLTVSDTAGGLFWDTGNTQWQIFRRVVEKRVLADGVNVEGRTTFSRPESCVSTSCTYGMTNLGYVDVDEKDASGNLIARQRHYFNGGGAAYSITQHWIIPPIVDDMEGRETQTDRYDANGTTLLRHSVNTWTPASVLGQGPQLTEVDSTLSDTNQVSKQTFTYDVYGNRTDSYAYDFGSGAAGALVRRTHTDFLTTNPINGADYACDRSTTCGPNANVASVIHIRSLPTQTSIYDAGGVERARATFEYDNYTSDTNHAPLVYRASISGLDSSYTTSYTTRGNGTASTHYLLVNGSVTGSITAYAQFDQAGNAVKVIDGRGYAASFDFTDCFGAPDGNARINSGSTELNSAGQYSYAFATKVTNALNQSAFAQFDYYLGQPVDGEDLNGVVASGYYNDLLDRPTQVRRAVGTSAQSQSSFSYDDTNRIVTSTSDRDGFGDNILVSKVLYDKLGRTTESRQYEGGTNYIAVQTQYDALGRAYRKSNPFRPWQSESAVWTTSAFDALGRIISVTTPDSAVVTSSFSGNTVTATDQAGKSRKSVSDALGRLTSVYEDPAGANYQTTYSYDVLDDLITVNQGVQTRSFVYDSLKRLTGATNPESGTISYSYDNNGNILTKIDARSITTTIAYDALNRPTAKTYSDGTPNVAYFYDAQALPGGAPSFDRGYSTGALVTVTYGGGSAGTYRGYDALGRVVRQYQQTDSVNYLVEAVYAPWGMTSETYPAVPGSGDRRTVTYTPDSAGRLASLNSNATTYAPAASVSSIGYASSNALNTETYGNSLVHAISYNNRLQPTEIKLGTIGNPTSILSLAYNYGTANNNGNVQSLTYNGGGLSYTQSFGYDSLNRLTTSNENGGASWSQTNGYDQYGNRWIDYGGGVHNLSFSTGNNRITTAGFSYDAAGNLTDDTIRAYTFDAESKIKTVDSVTAYVYDGEGHRVKKLVGENTRFVYGIAGDLLAEFDGSSGNLKKEYVYGGATLITIEPTAVNSNGTRYSTSDGLGSPRVVTNSSGSVVSRHDYMPFGEELGAGTGGRTTGMGFSVADGNRKKFTGYEADSETGLNFAEARYQSATQGRFTSPDPFSGSMTLTDPQTFNRYAYVGNNPLNSIDPSGAIAGRPGFSSIADFDLGDVTAAHANNDEIGDALEQWDYQVERTIKAAREADFLNAGLRDHTITEDQARARAADNPMLAVITQRQQTEIASQNLTVDQVSAIIFNETQSLSGDADALSAMYKHLAHAIINGDNQFGSSRPRTAVSSVSEDTRQGDFFKTIQDAVRSALVENRRGIDPTDGAQYFNLRPNDSSKPFQGHELRTHDGPFKNSFPSGDLPRGKDVYVNTYKYVPKSPKASGPIRIREDAHATRAQYGQTVAIHDSGNAVRHRFVLSKAVGCLMQHRWVTSELGDIGVREGAVATVRYRFGPIPETAPNLPNQVQLAVYSRNGKHARLFFLRNDAGRYEVVDNSYALDRAGEKWIASEGNGGLATYAAIGRYATQMWKRKAVRVRMVARRKDCLTEVDESNVLFGIRLPHTSDPSNFVPMHANLK
ncbi:MAG TPA: RHS repeat-associated core domain-containing protein [Pyrinomonadaceae bacterium]|nr:RHS repeat-associated core domain-containing protein [Pyrinomonadaceae bacterium]